MNNDLEQFSEERLKQVEASGLWSRLSHAESQALARIALAAKQAKPIGYFVHTLEDGVRGMTSIPDDSPLVKVATPLYTTPQPAHAEQDGWIKCSERMPDVGSSVLVVIQGKYVHKGHYSQWTGAKTEKGRKPRFEDLRGILRDVTHWMPLPEPPVAAPKPESE